jgi:hypothetical protein
MRRKVIRHVHQGFDGNESGPEFTSKLAVHLENDFLSHGRQLKNKKQLISIQRNIKYFF